MAKGISVEFDARQVYDMCTNLSPAEMKKVHRNALRSAIRVAQKLIRKSLQRNIGPNIEHLDFWNDGKKSRYKKKHGEAIFAKVAKDVESAAVRVPYFFGTKLFETGTTRRQTRKGYNRGSFEANNFFTEGLNEAESKGADELQKAITKGIIKQYQKKR